MIRERIVNNVTSSRLAIEVQLAVGARALGADVSHLEDDLVRRGVRLYEVYGAAQSLSAQEAQRRLEVVAGFVERTGTPIASEYFSPVTAFLKRNGGNNGAGS